MAKPDGKRDRQRTRGNPQMKLSLARWPDFRGDSSGFWLVRELPGFLIQSTDGGKNWEILCEDDYVRHDGPAATRLWGENWQPQTETYDRLKEVVERNYKTRGEAIMALEIALNPKNTQAISEIIQ